MNRHETDHSAHRELSALLNAPAEIPLADRFPITVDGTTLHAADVLRLLQPFLTEHRQHVLQQAVSRRTYSVIPVVEGLVNVGNVSAVIRSAEAMGYQEFQVITGGGRLKKSERTSQGAEKWLDMKSYADPSTFMRQARDRDYRVVAMHLDENAVPINEIDFTRKTALVFGNEAAGVSPEMLQHADATCIIPLDGLTESFNVSVAAAISLYHAREYRNQKGSGHADLSDDQRQTLLADFYLRSVGSTAEKLLKRLVRDQE